MSDRKLPADADWTAPPTEDLGVTAGKVPPIPGDAGTPAEGSKSPVSLDALRAAVESGRLKGAPLAEANALLAKYSKPEAPAHSGKPESSFANAMAGGPTPVDPEELRYKQSVALGMHPDARPSWHIPGVSSTDDDGNPVTMKDGSQWDAILGNIKGIHRDAALFASRSPAWQDPSDEALGGGTPLQLEQARNQAWAEAYDDAQRRGIPIYRAKDINEQSPAFMRVAKKLLAMTAPLEAGARGFDSSATFGAGQAAVDMVPTHALDNLLGPGAPTGLAMSMGENYQPAVKQNVKRGRQVVEENPGSYFVGAGVGAMKGAMGKVEKGMGEVTGLSNQIKAGQGQPLTKALGSSNIPLGLLKAAGTNAVTGAAYTAGNTITSSLEDVAAGLPTPSLEDAASAVGQSAAWSAAASPLALPSLLRTKAMTLPGGPGPAVTSLESGGGKTSAMHGVVPPPGFVDAQAKAVSLRPDGTPVYPPGTSGLDLKATELASDTLDHVTATSERPLADVASSAGHLSNRVLGDMADAEAASEAAVHSALDRTIPMSGAARTAEDKLVGDVMEHLSDKKMGQVFKDHAEMTGAALDSEGGKLVDMTPLVNKYRQVVDEYSFDDGSPMPAGKPKAFVDAIRQMTREVVVTEKAYRANYKDIAVGKVRQLAGKRVAIRVPRALTPSEFHQMTGLLHEASKYESASTAGQADRWKSIGAVALGMRKEALPLLSSAAAAQSAQRTEISNALAAIGAATKSSGVDMGSLTDTQLVRNGLAAALRAPQSDARTLTGMRVLRSYFSKYAPEMLDKIDNVEGLIARESDRSSFMPAGPGQIERAGSFQKLLGVLEGKDDAKSQAVLDSFGIEGAEARSIRERLAGPRGLIQAMGLDPKNVSSEELSVAMYDGLLDNDKFHQMLSKAPAHMRETLVTSREAAIDMGSMLKTLDLDKDYLTSGPSFRQGGGQAERAGQVDKVRQAIMLAISDGDSQRQREIMRLFNANPELKKKFIAVAAMSSYQDLVAATKNHGILTVRSPGKANLRASVSMSVLGLRLTGLLNMAGERQGKFKPAPEALPSFEVGTPFGAPVGWAAAGGSVTPERKGSHAVSGPAAFKALKFLVDAAKAAGSAIGQDATYLGRDAYHHITEKFQ